MKAERQIGSRILKSESVEWRRLQWLERNLKEISRNDFAKMKLSITTNQFIMPFHVWEGSGKMYILDGHHRQRALEELEADGWKIAKKLPANFVYCRDEREALKLVLIYSSIYAKVTVEGLYEHIALAELDFSVLRPEVSIPGIDSQAFELGFTPERPNRENGATKCICPECGHTHKLKP